MKFSKSLIFLQPCLGNTCGYRTCLVEAQFLITAVYPIYIGDENWIDIWNDASFAHQPTGNFDFENNCIAGPGNGGIAGTRQCCGEYPLRNPFFTGKKQCCDDVISPLGTC